MTKLNELEGYLATNPNKYTQMQNPMNLFGIQQPNSQPGVGVNGQPVFNV